MALSGRGVALGERSSKVEDEEEGIGEGEENSLLNKRRQEGHGAAWHSKDDALRTGPQFSVARRPVLILCMAGATCLCSAAVWRWGPSTLISSILGRPHSTVATHEDCVDQWELQYPAEVYKWRRHSCVWKAKWGQCDEFKLQCQRTCGECTPSSTQTAAALNALEEEPPRRSGITALEDDNDFDDTLRWADQQADTAQKASAMPQPSTEQSDMHTLPFASTTLEGTAKANHNPGFVSGARTQQEILETLKASAKRRRQQRKHTTKHNAHNEVESHSHSQPDRSKSEQEERSRVVSIDDSYEGPSS